MGSVAIPFSRIWLLSGVCTLRMMGDDSPPSNVIEMYGVQVGVSTESRN